MKYVRYFIGIILILAIMLSGCENIFDWPLKDEILVDTPTYTVERKNGRCYIDLKNGKEKEKTTFSQYPLGPLSFDSVEDMRDTILNGKLSEEDLEIIKNIFPRDEEDNILIIDPENIYVPQMPEDINTFLYEIQLTGEDCAFCYGVVVCYQVNVISRESFEYEMEGYNKFALEKDVKIDEKRQVEYRNATEYFYSSGGLERKVVLYAIEEKDKTIYVKEDYLLPVSDDGVYVRGSETVPNYVLLLGEHNGKYFRTMIETWKDGEIPSMERIKGYGVEKYEPED